MTDKKWKNANPPNYETNKDKLYPYSELPDVSEFQLVKIPHCVKNLIEHVDYYGAGRILTNRGYLGFPDCYNVNNEYRLVSAGKDEGRKIPNRIPIASNSQSDYLTSNYIKDNSVRTVTFTPYDEHMSVSIAKDIARIVNGNSGKVILYGYNINDSWEYIKIVTISEELKKIKQLFYCPIYMLPNDFQLTHYKTSYRVYLSLNELKKELYNNVEKGEYEAAIILTGCLTDVYCCNALSEVVTKLVKNKVLNVINYAYKLWTYDAKNIVCKYFPAAFKLMFNSDSLSIINKKYNQALIIDRSKKVPLCSSHDKSSSKAIWEINPSWDNDAIVFTLRNVETDLYLNLPSKEFAFNKEKSEKMTQKFYFEPLMIDGQVAFTITNRYYDETLDDSDGDDSDGDDSLREQHLQMSPTDSSENKSILGNTDKARDGSSTWIFAPWKPIEANDDCEEKDHDCISDIASI